MREPEREEPTETPPIPETTSLLRIGLSGEAPWLASARVRLSEGGPAWWTAAIDTVRAAEGLPDLVPGAPPPDLERWKTAAKVWAHRAQDAEAHVTGTVLYFVATALAMAEHGESLSSLSPAGLTAAWLDLSELAPEPYATVLARAAIRLEERTAHPPERE